MTVTNRLDGLAGGAAIKVPTRVATTGAITLSALQTIDGIALAAGDRVLVKNQADDTENGIWVADTGDWDRSKDFDGNLDVVVGTICTVNEGTINANTAWQVDSSDDPVEVGSSDITFHGALFSGASTITFLQSGTGAFARSVQDKERDFYSIKDFSNTGGGQVLGDNATVNTTGIQAAITAAVAAGKALYVPDGTYLCGRVTWTGALRIFGTGTLKCYAPVTIYAGASAWMEATGAANQNLVIEGVTLNNSCDDTMNPLPAYDDSLAPHTNWLGFFGLYAHGYTSVTIRNSQWINFKRAVLSYNNTSTLFQGNQTDCYTAVGQAVCVVESGDDALITGNRMRGYDFVNGFNNYGPGVSSLASVLGFNTDDMVISDNYTYGHQLVCRGTTISSVLQKRCVLTNNIIELPPADTAIYGYKDVVSVGNIIRKSGDMGLTFDYSQTVVCNDNVIDGTSVGGIYFKDAINITCNGNAIKDICQGYAEASHQPSGAVALGINVDQPTNGKIEYVAVVGNSLYFENLPDKTKLGLAIRLGISSNSSTWAANGGVVEGNVCHIDATNLPGWVVGAAECHGYINTVTGTFLSNETVVGGSSGNSSRYVYNTTTDLFFAEPTGPYTNNETLTGATSAATMIAENGGGGHAPTWMGIRVRNNVDRFSGARGTAVVSRNTATPYP